jgi:hypothetical protein
MKWFARLLMAVVASVFICPAMYSEPVRLMPNLNWAELGQPEWQRFRSDNSFSVLDGQILINTAGSTAESGDRAFEDKVYFYTVSLDRLLLNLIRLASPVTPATAPATSPVSGSPDDNKYVIGSAAGFYNPDSYLAERESRLQSSLEATLPLLGGPLLFDTLADPQSRFAPQSGMTLDQLTTMLSVEAEGRRPDTGLYWIKESFPQLQERALLVLLGIGLALLPAIYRRLKALRRFLPGLPKRLRKTVAMFRKPVYAPAQINPIKYESETPMPKRRRVLVKRDESWRRRPPVAATSAKAQPVSPEIEAPLPVTAPLRSVRESDYGFREHPRAQPSETVRAPRPQMIRERPELNLSDAAETVAESSATGTNGVTTRIYRLETPRPSLSDRPVAPPPQTVSTQSSDAFRSQRREENRLENLWPLTDEEDDALITRIEYDPRFPGSAAETVAPESSEDHQSFSDLRTVAMLAWLEPRVPALVEAVAWEEEHLGEYRGLPFADALSEEKNESERRKAH